MTSTAKRPAARPRPFPTPAPPPVGQGDAPAGGPGSAPAFRPMDRSRIVALRRMKATAAGLLVLAAVVYAVCHWVGHSRGAWGYLEAAAEASMVGGLADWFAVTALFRHPLALPIPHTAIIPRKKDQIGESLAEFVSDYFFTPEIIGERVAQARIPRRLGEWLADPDHARELAAEAARSVGGLAGLLRDDELRNAVASFADKRLREVEVAPILARLLDAARDSGQHQRALTAVLRGISTMLDQNRDVLRQKVAQESPDWVPEWVDERVFAKGFSLVQHFLGDVIGDDEHALRRNVTEQLEQFAERLRTDPQQAARIEDAKLELLDHPAVRSYLSDLWTTVKGLILDGAVDPDSDLRRSIESLVLRAGTALRDDPAIAGKVDQALQKLTGHLVSHYGDDLAAVITTTVERWDTAETSRRLELQVGRDLQFIRINGTVVGALAGLLIYTLAHLF
ncbi:MAG: DUF445 domain-containing protein [Jatrophihabitans sp.]|uniref:DUF445 domain-containing protein n=1 Tax=Jatrophihabitans sp. TaxID=1932789 RepID=UPI003F7EDF01